MLTNPCAASAENKIESVKRAVLSMITESAMRLTPDRIGKTLHHARSIDRRLVAQAIRELITEKAITYTHQFGCSFLELSFNRPVSVSDRIVLKPPDISFSPAAGQIVVTLSQGASFGSGEHPSTRLALRGIAEAFTTRMLPDVLHSRMLDVGTGTGVLAIAAVLLGIDHAVGVDIDPCSRAEAVNNTQLNGLTERVQITDDLEVVTVDQFSLITANLRAPTLKELKPRLLPLLLLDGGVLILSGIKKEEIFDIRRHYESNVLPFRWEANEKDWAALIFQSVAS